MVFTIRYTWLRLGRMGAISPERQFCSAVFEALLDTQHLVGLTQAGHDTTTGSVIPDNQYVHARCCGVACKAQYAHAQEWRRRELDRCLDIN